MSEIETQAAARPRVARRRVETRARLLSVAARLFAQRGFAGVRLDEIADEAEVARGTLYSHFSSKEDLLRAVVQPVLEQAVDCLQRVAPTLAPREAVEAVLRTYLVLWRLSPDAMRLAHRFGHDPVAPRTGLSALHEVHVRHVVDILDRAAQARLLRLDDPAMAARALATTVVPMLEIVSDMSGAEALFLESMAGLLLKAEVGDCR